MPLLHSRSATQYSLYGAVVHHGSVQTGHYTTFIRTGRDVGLRPHCACQIFTKVTPWLQWFYCNDEAVNRTVSNPAGHLGRLKLDTDSNLYSVN